MSRTVCAQCQRPAATCYCARICRINNHWPVTILQDPRESRHAIGTAGIAALSLQRCQLLRIDVDAPAAPATDDVIRSVFAPSAAPAVLIYPGEVARPIEELAGSGEHQLVFLDASWRRSRRILHTQLALADLPRFSLQSAQPSRYRIRRASEPGALSTLEAIAAALSLLENSPGRYQPMLDVMDWMIDQQIRHMGSDVYLSNYITASKDQHSASGDKVVSSGLLRTLNKNDKDTK